MMVTSRDRGHERYWKSGIGSEMKSPDEGKGRVRRDLCLFDEVFGGVFGWPVVVMMFTVMQTEAFLVGIV